MFVAHSQTIQNLDDELYWNNVEEFTASQLEAAEANFNNVPASSNYNPSELKVATYRISETVEEDWDKAMRNVGMTVGQYSVLYLKCHSYGTERVCLVVEVYCQ
ncbi:hypothetical protein Moror_9640 [Moniliophthora roreri MCA 2997]|uniref:Uncharacterized protein n=2 Tax=Moniliophthora roreri TaxID=221103 RepID=V2W4V3_MONRO|nr:hypothetical protein Moror_9640 [Moniliophthora roreri MCA 2997]